MTQTELETEAAACLVDAQAVSTRIFNMKNDVAQNQSPEALDTDFADYANSIAVKVAVDGVLNP